MKYLKYILILAVIGIATGFYMYNKPVKSTESRSADITLKADELFTAFEQNETEANKKYLDKVIAVEGVISSISSEDGLDVVIFKTASPMAGVVCKLEKDQEINSSLKADDHIRLKGICTGMLMDVIMIRCVIDNE